MRKGRRSSSFHTVAGTCARGQAQPDVPLAAALGAEAPGAAVLGAVLGVMLAAALAAVVGFDSGAGGMSSMRMASP